MSGIASSIIQSRAARHAAAAQERGAMASISEQRRQFNEIQESLSPFLGAGTSALSKQLELMGLGGEEAQQAAIQAIEQGPEFQAMVEQGESAMLQNASATGGLRGGNTQAALAQFRPQVLNQLVGQQYQRLGDVARMGQASAVQQGVAGQQMAAQVGQQYTNIGNAQAQSALAQGQAWAGGISNIVNLAGMYFGAKAGAGGAGGAGGSKF